MNCLFINGCALNLLINKIKNMCTFSRGKISLSFQAIHLYLNIMLNAHFFYLEPVRICIHSSLPVRLSQYRLAVPPCTLAWLHVCWCRRVQPSQEQQRVASTCAGLSLFPRAAASLLLPSCSAITRTAASGIYV